MSENPYQSTEAETAASIPPKRCFTPGRIILGTVVIAITIFLLLPSGRRARGPALRAQGTSNMKQILFALRRYEEVHGTLPPAYTVDGEGNRLHSWRTLILPYLDEQALYEQVDLTRPWDDPVNDAARQTVVYVYVCPASPEVEELTTYLAAIGPDGAFSGSTGKRIAEIRSGAASTVVLIDASADDAVQWMSPEEISIDDLRGYDGDTRVHHVGQFVYGMLDGSVHSIYLAEEADQFRALFPPQLQPER